MDELQDTLDGLHEKQDTLDDGLLGASNPLWIVLCVLIALLGAACLVFLLRCRRWWK